MFYVSFGKRFGFICVYDAIIHFAAAEGHYNMDLSEADVKSRLLVPAIQYVHRFHHGSCS